MSASGKIKRQIKAPTKLEEFMAEDLKDEEPRRSSRTPKISKKFKDYLNEKGSIKIEKYDGDKSLSPKKPSSISPSTRKGTYPKVVLKALPDSLINGKKKSPAKRSTERPSARRAASTQQTKKPITSSKLLSAVKVQSRPIKRNLNTDNKNTIAKKTKKAVQNPKTVTKVGPKSRVKRKVEEEESDSDIEEATVRKAPRLSRDIMTRLLSFGAEVAEAIAASNDAAFDSDDDSRERKRTLDINLDREEDFEEEEVAEIVKWIEEEEAQRRAYRKQIMESLRASHNTNMELYTQMLKVLQSATRGS